MKENLSVIRALLSPLVHQLWRWCSGKIVDYLSKGLPVRIHWAVIGFSQNVSSDDDLSGRQSGPVPRVCIKAFIRRPRCCFPRLRPPDCTLDQRFPNPKGWLYGNLQLRVESSLVDQGWIGYTGTHVPMFVHKLGLIKPRQT